MNGLTIGSILQYATLLSLLLGGVGLAVATFHHREQMKTQIFLALSARYDEILHSSSAHVWLTVPCDAPLPEPSHELSISTLRFCTLVSLTYYLFLDHHVPEPMWRLMLQSAARRVQSPLFAREWKTLRYEFESFPEFVALIESVQKDGGDRRARRTDEAIGRLRRNRIVRSIVRSHAGTGRTRIDSRSDA